MRLQPKSFPGYRAVTQLALTVLTGILLASCASKTSVSSTWHDKTPATSKFQNVIVVAMSDNIDSRMSFEDAVAYDLRGPETRAWSSSRGMGSQEEIDEENLRKLVAEKQADAVLVTRVTSMEIKPVEAGGRTDVIENQQDTGMGMVPERRAGTVFRYNYNETVEPVYTTAEYTTVLTTEVFSATTGEHVYTVVSSATKQESLAEVIDVLSDVIAKRLRDDGVIK